MVIKQAKRWEIREKPPEDLAATCPHVSPLLLQILYNRDIRRPDEITSFLDGDLVFHHPFLMTDMQQAVTRIRQAIRAQEPIAIYGDFDADGVTATVLLTETLQALGAQVKPYIPHRVDEGYGLNRAALTNLGREGFKLVITVDCGIRSVREVAHGRSAGLDFIITDHHSVGSELPAAAAVLNPKRADCPYPFKELAGVGVAFKLAQALLLVAQASGLADAVPLQEHELLDLVALGTIADVVPLLGENRQLVRRGLEELNPFAVEATGDGPSSMTDSGLWDRTSARPGARRRAYPRRPGLRALMEVARLGPGHVTTSAVGFILGPRLNAAGRLGDAMRSYDLLSSRSEVESQRLALSLEQLNRRRRQLTQDHLDEARTQAAKEPGALLYLLDSEEIPAGVAGLVAGRLTEELYRPSVIVQRGKSVSRGSARSIEEFDITKALDRCSELLERHGGHAAAAGFTVRTSRLDELRSRLMAIATEELAGQELTPRLLIDSEIGLDELDWATLSLLQQVEPCGHGNEPPVLMSRGVEISDFRTVGADDRHLKMGLSDGGRLWDAIAFRQGEWAKDMPQRVDIAYRLEVNEWNGRRNLQLNVLDLRPSE